MTRARDRRLRGLILASVLFSVIPGCRREHLPDVVPASGAVFYQGQPLMGATVIFVTERGSLASGEFASATTDAQGRFRLAAQIPGNRVLPGAVPGKYRVIVSKFVPPTGMSEEAYRQRLEAEEQAMASRGMVTREESAPSKVELLPAKYSNAHESSLSAVVEKQGRNDFVFKLAD